MIAKVAATIITGTIARPSRPSVKFTAFAEPTITIIIKGIEKYPKFIKTSLSSGRVKRLRSSIFSNMLVQ